MRFSSVEQEKIWSSRISVLEHIFHRPTAGITSISLVSIHDDIKIDLTQESVGGCF
jgi:hypothetical protein